MSADDRAPARFPGIAARAGEGVIEPFFQPVVRLSDNRIVSFEALARWRRPDGAIAFIEMFPAHAWTDEVLRASRYAAEAAITRFAALRGDAAVALAVNLTARDLADGAARALLDVARKAGLPPAALTFELTEHHWIDDLDRAAAALAAVRAEGARIALDDFGTGHSSLAWLARLPVDLVKIDQSFVRGMPHAPASAAIVRALLGLCAELGLAAIAEGVETEAQAQALAALGCPLGQGRLWSMPLPVEAAMALL